MWRVQVVGVHANGLEEVDLRGKGLTRDQLPLIVAAVAELPVVSLHLQGA